jgi:hypothetical protein
MLFAGFVFFAVYAILLNELNVRSIQKLNPANEMQGNRSLTFNATVTSVDNYWYVNQIENYVKGYGFTIDPLMEHYDVRRTPVYPMFYGLHYLLFGKGRSYFFIRYTQVLIFALSAIALFIAAYNFTQSNAAAYVSACLYGLNPTLVSFLYYTITESLSPSLVCFLLYFLSHCYRQNNRKDWLLAGIFFALASLCRPAVSFMFFPSAFLCIYKNRDAALALVCGGIFSAGAAILFVPHIVRNYMLTKEEIIVLEKYYGDPMDFGMPNMALRSWISCWMNPADYSSEDITNHMNETIYHAAYSGKKALLDAEFLRLPARGTIANSREDIRDAYSTLYDYYEARIRKYPKRIVDSLEHTAIQKLETLKAQFIAQKPFQYYFVTPALIVKSVVMQSNSASLAFLDNYRGNFLKTSIKLGLYALNIYLFMALAGMFFYARRYAAVFWMTLLYAAFTFIYITFSIKYFEARYLIPLFPLLYLNAAVFSVEIFGMLKRRLHF